MVRSLLLCLFALSLPLLSTEIPLGKTVRLTTRGGGVTQFLWREHSLVPANGETGTLTEVAFASRGDASVDGEAFGNLEFQAQKPWEDVPEGPSLLLHAQGVQAFRWLRLQKQYTLQKDGSLRVDYTLRNLDDKPHKAGLWIRSLLREGEGDAQQPNRYFFSRQDGQLDSFVHPGPGARGDLFVMNPGSGTAGVCGPRGVGALVCLPDDEVEAFYFWRSESNSVATLEWFIREEEIEGGLTRQFTLFLLPCRDVPARMKGIAKNSFFSREEMPCLLPRILAGETPGGVYGMPPEPSMPVSQKYMDVSGRRQFFPSVRAVRFPAETDLSRLGVYECANGRERLDRPVLFRTETLPSGEQRALFLISGVNPKGFYYTKFQDGAAYDMDDAFLGEGDFHVRLCLDLPQEQPGVPTPREEELLAGGPQLLVNGDVEESSSQDSSWPWGFPWSEAVRSRGMFFWEENGSFDGSRCLRLQLPEGSSFWSIWPIHFRPEPGVRYTASCYATAENPDQDWAVVQVIQLNGEGKHLRERNVHLQHDKVAFPWKKLEQSFFVEEDVKTAALEFSTLRCPTVSLSMDKFSVVPEDFTYVKRDRKEVLREELMGNRNPHVEIIEHLDDSVTTPHEKWLADPAQPLDGVLYLPLASTRSVQTPFRRTILEMAQRMPLEYQYIPLFRKVLRFEHGWDVTFGDSLEEYTMECLRQVQETPRVVLVQAMDFRTMVQPEFVEELLRFRREGANLLFLGCQNVPDSLLGEETPLPPSWTTLPRMCSLPDSVRREGLRGYRSPAGAWSVCFQPSEDEWYLLPKYFECVPQEQVAQNVPSLWGRDFPYWEYLHLQTLKLLRGLAEIPLPARLEECREDEVTVVARESMTANLRVRVLNLHRRIEREYTRTLSLEPGEQKIRLSREGLPGGRHVAHLFLEDQEGRGLDCGATAFSLPETHPLALTFSHEDRIYRPGEEVEISFACPRWPRDARLTVRISEAEGRVLQEETLVPRGSDATMTFTPLAPLARLYRVEAILREGEDPRGEVYGEFALRILKDPRRMDALVWLGYYPMLKTLRDLGFTHQMVNLQQDMESMGMLHALADVGLQMVATRAGQLDVPQESEMRYRGDIASDPVRNPCYSDPAFLQDLHARIRTRMEQQHYAFYGITLQEIADEAFLGRSVCYSPFCLAGFRQRLQEEYDSLDDLNQEWETRFRRWDEVVPCQLEELPSPENLSRWLDHKLFMTALYAKNWVGGTREAIRQAVPESQAGLSGTQVPGLSYDWVQLMKYIDCLSFYGGIQRKLVHDLAKPGFVAGEWTGYCLAYQVNEFDQKTRLWDNLFLGSNFSSIFMGHGMHGDLSPNPNMKLYSQGLKEIRKGADCLVLSAQECRREVGVLYSQASLFTASGSLGANVWHNSQTGWAALLADLKQPFRYVTYEELDQGVPADLKVLVLPCTLALSTRALDHLRSFVEEGGTLLADFAPAVADGHGKFRRRPEAESLFGVDRSESTRNLVEFSLDNWGKCTLRYGESGLRLQEARAGETAPDGTPVLLERTLGNGRVCLLNLLLTGYQEVLLGGVGGELLTTKSGNGLFCQKIREWMDGELQRAGVSPRVQATLTETGELYPAHTTLRQDGENLVFGMVKPVVDDGTGKYPMLFANTPQETVTVRLPVEGFLYDVRKGVFLGEGSTFTTTLVPGDAILVSILARKPEGVSLQAPESVRPAAPVELHCRLEGGEGPQIFRLEVTDPRGNAREEYQQVIRGEDAQAELSFAFALNDPKGAWTLTLCNVNTGLRTSSPIRLEE
ncbi:MAG: beta-galactosidase [Oligosphaeraceae bacterium]